jgi:hypothetical protein
VALYRKVLALPAAKVGQAGQAEEDPLHLVARESLKRLGQSGTIGK